METASVGEKAKATQKSEKPLEKPNWLYRLKEQAILIGIGIAGVLLIGGGLSWVIFGYFSKHRSLK